jgi:hypothetical protein
MGVSTVQYKTPATAGIKNFTGKKKMAMIRIA